MRLDARSDSTGTVTLLPDTEWHQSRARLEQLGGPPR
jgi:hypothetical protein